MKQRKRLNSKEFRDLQLTPGEANDIEVTKSFVVHDVEEVKQSESDDRILRFTISDGSIDRDGDTIAVDGWELGNYLKNPVVLFAHDGKQPPVARANNIFFEDGKMKSDTLFMPKELYAFSDMLYKMYLGGFMRATSVGFSPSDWEFSEERNYGVDFTKQELHEYSLVPVPANPNALIEARKAKIDTVPLIHWAEELLDDPSYEGLILSKFTLERMRKDADPKDRVMVLLNQDKAPEVITESKLAANKSAIGYDQAHSGGTPKAAKDAEWNSPAEIAAAEVDDLKIMATWVDDENTDNKTAYKLPHHKAGGEHNVVWRGVAAAMGALMGARGGLDVPEADRKSIYDHLSKHYAEFDEEAPAFKYVQAQALKDFTDQFDFDYETGQVIVRAELVDNHDIEEDLDTDDDLFDDLMTAEDEGQFDEDGFELDPDILQAAIESAINANFARITGKLN